MTISKQFSPSVIAMSVSLVMSLSLVSTAKADGTPSSPAVYYQMGGGDNVSGALNPSAASLSINVTDLLPSSCDIWENRENLDDYMEHVIKDYVDQKVEGLNGLVNNLVTIISAGGSMIAISVLERALPGMYDWMTNLSGMIDLQMEASMNSCQVAIGKMQNGSSPVDAWLNIATSEAWRQTLDSTFGYDGSAGVNINQAAREMPETARTTPVKWFGGFAGATSATPIRVTTGIVSAGYAASANNGTTLVTYDGGATGITPLASTPDVRLGAGSTTPTSTRPTRISQLFPSSNDAVEFGIKVLGEEAIVYCADTDCDSSVTPGVGMKAVYSEERDDLIREWTTLLAANPVGAITNPTIAEFDAVSSPSTRITMQVYNALRDMREQDRNVAIYKLVSDVATENVVEKGLALRQMIHSGTMTPQIQSYDITKEKAAKLAGVTRDAIEEFVWEVDMKRKLASNTAASLLAAGAVADSVRAGSNPGIGAPTVVNELRGGDVIER